MFIFKVSGSAKYLHNEVKTENTARVTYYYKRESHQEVIKGATSTVNAKECANDKATHFISKVNQSVNQSYGMNSYTVIIHSATFNFSLMVFQTIL